MNPVLSLISSFLLILSSHLRLYRLSGLLHSGFRPKIFHAVFVSSIFAMCLTHLTSLDSIILITLEQQHTHYKVPWQTLRSFLRPHVTYSLSGTNILLSALFSDILNQCSSLKMRDQVSKQYKTEGKIMLAYILVFTFLEHRLHDKICEV